MTNAIRIDTIGDAVANPVTRKFPDVRIDPVARHNPFVSSDWLYGVQDPEPLEPMAPSVKYAKSFHFRR